MDNVTKEAIKKIVERLKKLEEYQQLKEDDKVKLLVELYRKLDTFEVKNGKLYLNNKEIYEFYKPSNGFDGKDGYIPVKGKDYRDGIDGKDGKDGKNGRDGKDGKDGYTPIKGKDYFDGKDGRDGINAKKINIVIENGILKWHYQDEEEKKDLFNINDLTNDLKFNGLRAMSEAPKDSKVYGRKNKKWEEIDLDSKEDINKSINTLTVVNGIVSPLSNTINKLTLNGDCEFVFPTITDNSKFYQILIQLTTNTTVAIDWNTTDFFGGDIPDIDIGKYDVIAEYNGTNWVVGIIEKGAEVNTVDDVQVDGVSVVENKTANIDLSGKMDKNNAVGTGSFSVNRRGKQGVGRNSVTLGEGCDASGEGAISMGYYNKVQGARSAAIGRECDANNGSCYVIGKDLVTNNPNQTIIGNFNEQAPSNAVVLADGTSTNDTHNAIQITRSSGASSIDVNGNTVINGTATVNNTMNIAQGLTVGGNEVVNGNLNVSGISSFTNTATFNSALNAKYSGITYNVGAKLAELSNLKEANFSSKLMWNNNTVELKPGMVFLFPSDCSVTVTIVGRKGLKTNPVQTYTLAVQDLCGGICTEVGEADEDGKDSNYWRMFIGYRTGTLSFDSDTYYISKSNTVSVTCNVAGGRWAYFISK